MAGEELETRRCFTGGRDGEPQVRKVRKDGWTAERREIFLSHLAMTSNVSAAARAAGKAKKNAYDLRRRDAGFRAAWMEALAEGFEHLELEMLERFRFGARKTVVQLGKVRTERVYSDAVGMRLLTVHRENVVRYRAETGDRAPEEVAAEMRERLEEVRARLAERDADNED